MVLLVPGQGTLLGDQGFDEGGQRLDVLPQLAVLLQKPVQGALQGVRLRVLPRPLKRSEITPPLFSWICLGSASRI